MIPKQLKKKRRISKIYQSLYYKHSLKNSHGIFKLLKRYLLKVKTDKNLSIITWQK